MNLKCQREVANTREKLRLLEASYEALSVDSSPDAEMRQASMESLMRLINQFKEEIARFEAHQSTSPAIAQP